jgi:hypothetical protein
MSDERLDRGLGEPFRAEANVDVPGPLTDRVESIPTLRHTGAVVIGGPDGSVSRALRLPSSIYGPVARKVFVLGSNNSLTL